jgi:hypothetical protein
MMTRPIVLTCLTLFVASLVQAVSVSDEIHERGLFSRGRTGTLEPSRVIRDVYEHGDDVLMIMGLPYDTGAMDVVLKYRRSGKNETRLFASSIRFSQYEQAIMDFFSSIDDAFVGRVQKGFEKVVEETAGARDDGSIRAHDRAQLTLMELGILSFAKPRSASRPHPLDAANGWDCARIAVLARNLTACAISAPTGPVAWTGCLWAIFQEITPIAPVTFLTISSCQHFIAELICESNGYPWRYIPPNDGEVAGWCVECYDHDAHACDMVVSALDNGGSAGDPGGRVPENQDPSSGNGGGGGWSSIFWGVGPGGVSTGSCFVILLPNGGVYVACH